MRHKSWSRTSHGATEVANRKGNVRASASDEVKVRATQLLEWLNKFRVQHAVFVFRVQGSLD